MFKRYPTHRETGKEPMLEFWQDEGIASSIGPEPWMDAREGVGRGPTDKLSMGKNYMSRALMK